MRKLKAVIDTNIFLDVFLEREGSYDDSRAVLKLCEDHVMNGFLTASSITDIFYILRKGLHDSASAYDCLGAVLDIAKIIPVTEENILDAYKTKASDFEDCLLSVCAKSAGCDVIITRNIKDFKDFKVPPMEPDAILQWFSAK